MFGDILAALILFCGLFLILSFVWWIVCGIVGSLGKAFGEGFAKGAMKALEDYDARED